MTNFVSKMMFLVAYLVFTQAYGATESEQCQQTILFLPQTHRNVIAPQLGEGDGEEVYRSQYEVGSFIQANPDIPVFSEQVDENLKGSELRGDLLTYAEQLKQIFPSGFPKRMEELTASQKEQLVYAGADAILLLTGKIADIYKVVPDRRTQDAIFNRIQELLKDVTPSDKVRQNFELGYLLKDIRERLALNEIKKFFAVNPTQKSAILIYGRLHDFRRHPDIFPGACIKTPPGF